MKRARIGFALTVAAVLAIGPVSGAEPQPYEVTLQTTGDTALDGALHDSSSLISLKDNAPVGGFSLVQRARDDLERFQTALNSYGYYKAQVRVTIDGLPLDDVSLPDRLDKAPASPPVPVVAKFDLGPRFKLGQVTVDPPLPAEVADTLQLAPGQPAMASDVLAAQGRMLSALRDAGYPLAQVPTPVATLRPGDDKLDVAFHPQPGPRANIGRITITGLKDTNESFVRERLLLHPGERYSPAALDRARQDLASTGVFAVVRMEPATQLAPDGTLPVTVDVTERPLHAVDLSAAYSTDLGINLGAGWHHRNLFGNAEQLNLTGSVQLGGNSTTRPGYQFGAQFIKPDFLRRDQSLEIDLGAVKQSLEAYEQKALTEKIALNRKLSDHWTASLGIAGEQEQITQEGVTRNYNLIGLPAVLRYDSTNNLLDPTSGVRATFSVTPTQSLGASNATFFIMQAAGSTYIDMTNDGRTVLAMRGLVGQASGVGVFGLPPDQRFYAGGGGTVRGYRYQSIGPRFPDRKPTGGTAVSAGSVELRQRILGNYGVVAFLDAGQVSSDGAPFTSQWRTGAGFGFRYYTPIGPIRADVAVPLNKRPGDDSFELYIGIGQAF